MSSISPTAKSQGSSSQTAIPQEQIQAAARTISPYVRLTPVITLEDRAFGINAQISLKLESLQHAGSFKPRGAFNCILSLKVPDAGVIAASGGNHGAAVAFAAQQLGHKAEIFVPTISSPNKINRLRQYGATANVVGRDYFEALAASRERAAVTGALAVHAYDDPYVLAGQGTLGMEFDQQVPELDSVLIAVGGGGLIGGVASWFRDRVRVIGVEPERAQSLRKSLDAHHVIEVETSGVAADSLGARRVGELMFPIAQQFVPEVVLVTDEQIIEAQRTLWQKLRVIAEPGGATALAALLSGAYQPKAGERVGVVICGGNAELGSFPT
jgi:threonine dehydratase